VRDYFASILEKRLETDPEMVLLVGDIGNRMFDNYKAKGPKNFFNCGIAEANMSGVAAGLASAGRTVLTYTITPFNSYRCYEQIRLDIAYPRAPVMVVGTGSGLSYSSLGATHHSLNDIQLISSIPGIRIFNPGDRYELKWSLERFFSDPSPSYLRLGKKGEPDVHEEYLELNRNFFEVLSHGTDVYLVNSGTLLPQAVEAANLLHQNGINVTLYSAPEVGANLSELANLVSNDLKPVVTLEEHSVFGGFGHVFSTQLFNTFSQNGGSTCSVLNLGAPHTFLSGLGHRDEALKILRLDAFGISETITEFIT